MILSRVYLKRLELTGFKSFASKTVLDFLANPVQAAEDASGDATERPGRLITAIVGPNGSGKSNIADAIRWAIGEQSLKNLRGKKSEDVIFAGTDKKTKLGAASVTLSFDNSDQRIPIEFAEVAITRKIYRSGESEYLINGSKVRLMDIVDILAKAGIGKDSYCVITQGMSDALLQATPAERRAIFEDAAGVKQYQIEKERAKRKLESTEENLQQVDALVREIEPHLKNLRRQAEKASQGKDLAAKLRARQLLLYGHLWHGFTREREALYGEREALQSKVHESERTARALQSEVQALSAALSATTEEETLESSLEILRRDLNGAVREMSALEGRRESEVEKQRERETVEIIPVDLPFVQARLEEIKTLQAELIEKLQRVERLEDLQEIREFAIVIRQRLADLRAQAGEGTVRQKKILALPPSEAEASRERRAALEKAIADLNQNILGWEQTILEKTQTLTELRTATKERRATLFAQENAWREAERTLAASKDTLNELKVRLARVEVREEDLTALVRGELGIEPHALAVPTEPVEREKLEREVARLKVEVEHVGAIDPLIVEEYEETEKRFQFLTQESADLRRAIAALGDVIKEMDAKIDTAFQATFGDIQGKFSEYFTLIFGGGKAELALTKTVLRRRGGNEDEIESELSGGEAEPDSAAPFEVGIELTASPPGKRITHLSMLSGGERALTSLALLFAIIAHNPPPFAVLDEVEAALDEANSRRFGKVLRELSARTQFVAITHNRETMRQAGLLYGVTMGEDGVSKLLSVRLDQVGEGGKLNKSAA